MSSSARTSLARLPLAGSTLTALAASALAAGALAAPGPDPAAIALAKSLKADMQRTLRPKVEGIHMTKVTCTLAKNHKTGHCKAYFTIAAQQVKGVYQVAITVNTATGAVRSRALSVTCTDSKTGDKVLC